MGYYSTVDVGAFESRKSVDECNEIARTILNRGEWLGGGSLDMIESCTFNAGHEEFHKTKDGLHLIVPDFSEYNAKWYDDCEFAFAYLIAILIAPGYSTDLYMVGEDGEQWGYRIRHMQITNLQHVWKELKNSPYTIEPVDVVAHLI